LAIADLGDWLNSWQIRGSIWYLKRLAANDTLANEAHQAGPYIPKEVLFEIFPALNAPAEENPDVHFDAYIDSHSDHKQVRAVWYNNRLRGGTRNEARITNWGGASSALLNPDSTGSLALFAFIPHQVGHPRALHVWVCSDPTEEDLAEDRVSPVAPGEHAIWRPADKERPRLELATGRAPGCRLAAADMPEGWRRVFPSGIDIVRKVCELRPARADTPDKRLMRRRECEFELFQSIEEVIEGEQISHGFHSIADFLTTAQRILQRRKARSGRSLELQTLVILTEEGLVEGRDFSHHPESDPGKEPDFLFPSQQAYTDSSFPADRLRLLAAKTTCKDRWRQVINEADRIAVKHLLTLQEGVSVTQYAEMKDAGIRLVVPESLTPKFPAPVRDELTTLRTFIDSVRNLRAR
jgi:hypothetical protein